MATKKTKGWIKQSVPKSSNRWEIEQFTPAKVDAWVVDGIPDLFVNRHKKGKKVSWVITHKWTGYHLGYSWKKRGDAIAVMKVVAEVADWHYKTPKKLHRHNPLLKSMVSEVALESSGLIRVR